MTFCELHQFIENISKYVISTYLTNQLLCYTTLKYVVLWNNMAKLYIYKHKFRAECNLFVYILTMSAVKLHIMDHYRISVL